MSKNKNLFIVSTPFQLLNAIEAQNYFKTQNNVLVLLFYGHHVDEERQMRDLIKIFPYSDLVVFDAEGSFSYLRKIIRLLDTLKKCKYSIVFTGFFSANVRRYLANIEYDELYLIDDGVYSIAIHNELYSPNADEFYKYIIPYTEIKLKSKLKRIAILTYHYFRNFYIKLHGFRNEMRKIDTNFFTIFKLPKQSNEIIISNEYTHVREMFGVNDLSRQKIKEAKDQVYFLGQPLDRSLGMTQEEYILHLIGIFSSYSEKGKSVIYVPHRRENNKLVSAIQLIDLENFDIVKINLPFELYLLKNKFDVDRVASFTSTALFSVKKLYPNAKIDVFKIPTSGKKGKTTELVFEKLAESGAQLYSWDDELERYLT